MMAFIGTVHYITLARIFKYRKVLVIFPTAARYVPSLLEIGNGRLLDDVATSLSDDSGLGTAIDMGDFGRARQ